jgi:hypothetical protein
MIPTSKHCTSAYASDSGVRLWMITLVEDVA